MEPMVKVAAGLDVHRDIIVVTVAKTTETGSKATETREFGSFSDNLKDLATWLKGEGVESALMESTSVLWLPVFEALEALGIRPIVGNASHLKNVPGRKTDKTDSQWLAEITLCGLINPSLIPDKLMRDLRQISRQIVHDVGDQSSVKNRIIKLLESAGIKLSSVLSDVFGVSGKIILTKLAEFGTLSGISFSEILPEKLAKRLKKPNSEFERALKVQLTKEQTFLLNHLLNDLTVVEKKISSIETFLNNALESNGYGNDLQILQTIPGVSLNTAQKIVVEMGGDVSEFKSASNFCAWAGVAPGNNESAGKKKLLALEKVMVI